MIYIDKCRTDLGVTVDEWAVDDRCRFSDSGKVGIGTGVRVLDITDKFGDVLVRLVISDSCLLHLLDAECRLLRCLLCVDRITEMIYSLDLDAVLSAAFHILAELCVYRLCVSFTKDCELDAVCCYSGKVYIALPI